MADLSEERSGGASLLGLIKRVPELVTRLVRDEIRAAQREIASKAKATGLGAGLAVGGAVFALFALGALMTAAMAALDLVVARWLSALIVAAAFLVVATVLALLGDYRLGDARLRRHPHNRRLHRVAARAGPAHRFAGPIWAFTADTRETGAAESEEYRTVRGSESYAATALSRRTKGTSIARGANERRNTG